MSNAKKLKVILNFTSPTITIGTHGNIDYDIGSIDKYSQLSEIVCDRSQHSTVLLHCSILCLFNDLGQHSH